MHIDTKCLTPWTELDATTATTINSPIYHGSTVLFRDYAELCSVGSGEYKGIVYGTDRLPNQRQLEAAICELDGAAATRVYPSGIAAIQGALTAFLKAGDHLLICDNAYHSGRQFCEKVLTKFAIETSPIPANVGADITGYLRPNTRAILLESPGSITFELQDIREVTKVAREKGIITLIDNTWATPLYFKPFSLGVDVIIYSLTKYIAGYSDILAGSVSVNKECAEVLTSFYKTMETHTESDTCAATLRGLRSLPVRLRQHETSALTIAKWLQNHPLVADVLHPALPEHPEHLLWKRDFCGSAGLFAFIFKKEYAQEQLAQFIDCLNLFKLGFSWGGYQSLITAAKVWRESESNRYHDRTIVRLNIGLENTRDLLEDLEKGLQQL